MALDAVVMAAGEGTRLRPLTDRWAKPVLPIDGRPVIGTLVRDLAEAGLERVTVVVGHLGHQVRELLGDGAGFGVPVRYVEQPEAHGSGDAVRRALGAGADAPLLVAAADTVFSPGAVEAAAQAWLRSETAAGIAVRAVPTGELAERSAVRTDGGRVLALGGDLPSAPALPRDGLSLAAAPLWFLGASVVERIPALAGPPYELADALRAAIAAGDPVAALDVGPTRDLTRPADLVSRNFPYLG